MAGQDRIEFTLVPFDDGRRGYRFAVTPLGLQADAQVLPEGGSGGRDDTSWNAAWVSAGSIDAEGYTIEAAIPFAEVRFPAGGSVWGFSIERLWPRGSEVRLRSEPWNRRDACDLCQASRLTNLEGVTPGGAVRIAPTLTASHAGEGVASVTGSVPLEATARTRALASELAWDLTVIDAREFARPEYMANPVNRCFYCKESLYAEIARYTGAQVLSGANTDDLSEYRPGLDEIRFLVHPHLPSSAARRSSGQPSSSATRSTSL